MSFLHNRKNAAKRKEKETAVSHRFWKFYFSLAAGKKVLTEMCDVFVTGPNTRRCYTSPYYMLSVDFTPYRKPIT
jgi:hypothetical protein